MKINVLAVCMALGAAQLCAVQMPEGFRMEEVKFGFAADAPDESVDSASELTREHVVDTLLGK